MLRYYHYRNLSRAGQAVYRKLAAAICRFYPRVEFGQVGNLQVIVEAVKNDNPHFFHVDWGYILYKAEFHGARTVVYLHYWIARERAKQYLQKARQMAIPFAGSKPADAIRKVHDFLALRTRYNKKTVAKDVYLREDHNMIGPLFERIGVCEGIARAAQFLLREVGVDCTYCCGYVRDAGTGEGGYHAWNLVRVDGKILKMDVTWDLSDDIKRISRHYFCVPPDAT